MFERIFRFATRFPGLLVSAGIVGLVAAGIFAAGVFGDLSSDNGFNATGTEAARTSQAIAKYFPGRSPDAVILFRTYDAGLTVEDSRFKQAVESLLGPLVADGAEIQGFYTSGSTDFISSDKQATFVTVKLPKGTPDDKYKRLSSWQDQARSTYVTASLGGELAANQQSSQQVETDLKLAELITLPVLALLLLVIFRGVVAAALPLILGVVSIIGGIAVVRVLANVTDVDQYALNVITVLGLGLSVDYSLLMVSRFREELQGSASVRDAVRRTVMTSGRTIFFSGLTVIASLLSLVIFPIGFLRSIGLGGTSAIIVAVVSALVLLPAMLMLVGRRIDSWRLPVIGRRPPHEPSLWHRLGTGVTRYPWPALGLSVFAIAAIAWPLTHVRFIASDYKALPAQSSARQVATALATDFGSGSSPVQVVFRPSSAPLTPQGVAETLKLTKVIEGLGHVKSVESPTPTGSGLSLPQLQALYSSAKLPAELALLKAATVSGRDVLLSVRYDEGGPTDIVAQNLVKRIRSLHAQGTLEVGGEPADFLDTTAIIKHYLPVAGLIIAASMFFLLGLLLRSVVIPLQAIIINAVGLAATFGVLVFIFQDGHFTSDMWLSRTDGLTLTIPLLVFSVAFGLSMDYGAFLYSRMREEIDRGKSNNEAITVSLDRTGSIITAAALLLFVVVAAFMSSKVAFLQQVGVGLSVAVLVDAFIIRLILVPAVMTLFGKTNWYGPRWMRRFQIRHE